jgi:PilZ domain
MPEPVLPMDLRKSPRARLRLPARIRWLGPLGMRLEVAQTVDVSREGLLIRRAEPCDPQARVWVAYPFDLSVAATVQPETPARIARVRGGASGGFYVGLKLMAPPRECPRAATDERRSSLRFPFALPIFVRPSSNPWPEESMTQNISNNGVRFESAHPYTVGEMVLAKIPWGEWTKAGEILGRVVRVDSLEEATGDAPASAVPQDGLNAVLTSVAVRWMSSGRTLDAETTRALRMGNP